MTENQGPLPLSVPESEAFTQGIEAGELRIQRCHDCASIYFPPRPFCPDCGSRNVEQFAASGRATLYSYIISHLATPGFEPPYSIAVVELEEGPRMMTNIVDCEQTPEALQLDMALEVTFQQRNEVTLPLFRPVAMP
ncbi:MAG: Zn-ribbon domain-containing OB-fold protein [Pseudomonadota bacterium]